MKRTRSAAGATAAAWLKDDVKRFSGVSQSASAFPNNPETPGPAAAPGAQAALSGRAGHRACERQ